MFAILESGGKQYKVSEGQFFEVEKINANVGDKITLSNVLLISNDDSNANAKIGTPFIDGAKVECEVLEQAKGEKVLIFKKKRRTNYRRKIGHRQLFAKLKVISIIG